MEAEYIVFLQSMRDHIPLREVIKEIYSKVFRMNLLQDVLHTSKHFSKLLNKNFQHQLFMKIILHAYSFQNCQIYVLIPNILDCLADRSEAKCLL